MVERKLPLLVLSKQLPWAAFEHVLAPLFACQIRTVSKRVTRDWLDEHDPLNNR